MTAPPSLLPGRGSGTGPGAGGLPACPVCGVPGTSPDTAHCGWDITGPLVAGPVTGESQAALRTELDRARRGLGTQAALRAAHGAPRDRAAEWTDRLMTYAVGSSGAPVSAEERRAAEDLLAAEPAPRSDDVTPVLRALVDGDADRIVVAVLGGDGLYAVAVTRGPGGRPNSAEARTIPWQTLIPALPHDPVHARFLLAGGRSAGAGELSFAEEALAPVGRLAEGGRVVLISQLPGWPSAERLMSILRRRHPNASTLFAEPSVTPAEAVDHLLGGLPTQHAYALALTRHDELTGLYVVEPLPLFTVTGGASSRAQHVEVRTPPAPDGSYAVNIAIAVVDLTGERREEWELVRAVETEVRADASVSLDFTLEGEGDVRISVDGRLQQQTSPLTWRELLDRMDRAQRELPLDVVVLIEIGGERNALRIEGALRLLEHVREGRPAESVHVSVRPYWRHDHGRSGRTDPGALPFAPKRPLKSFDAALEELKDLEEFDAPVLYYAAALEDALDGMSELGGWHDGDRSLLVVASRAPYSDPDGKWGGYPRPCPAGLDWRTLAREAGEWLGRTVLLVEPEPGDGDYDDREAARSAARTWRQAADDGWDVIELTVESGEQQSSGVFGTDDDPDPEFFADAANTLAPSARTARPVPFPLSPLTPSA
ncbi:hypothetical protein OG741_34180 [Streptomyces sp. NBC_01410]|uniref:hypothetical protein n=1 Tax=Streptomyces sp. NBC_01410 TaxID=2903856 RepID=UPI003246764F